VGEREREAKDEARRRAQLKGQKAKAKRRIFGRAKAWREVALAVLLVQVPERGLVRLLLIGLMQGLE
jgi:type II secretory pathway component PulL